MSLEGRSYTTVHGDTVDDVLWRQLQRTDDQVEALFWQLNPDASAYGVIFPAGVKLVLPVLASAGVSAVAKERVSVWD